MRVVLFGATGVVGQELSNFLIKNENVTHITLLTRRQTIFSNLKKISEIIIPNMTIEKILDLNISADHFVCTLGSTIKKSKTKDKFFFVDHDLVLAFAKLTKKSKAKSFQVVSSMGSHKDSLIFYNQTKGLMEQSVKDLGLHCLIIYRPSLLISNRSEFRLGEKFGIISVKIMRPFLGKRLSKVLGTDVTRLAKKMNDDLSNIIPGTHYIEAGQI